MSTLRELLVNDIQASMKNNRLRLPALRGLLTEVVVEEKRGHVGSLLADAELIPVIIREKKKYEETIMFAKQAERHDLVLSAMVNIEILLEYLPKQITDEEFERIRDALDTLSKAPIYIDDQPSITVLKMRSVARRLKSEKNLGLLIVDYLQLITPANTRIDSEVQQVTEISRSLKGLARELNIPVLALSQLSRAIESRGGRPRLSDLRSSGSLEQDADVVMFIHREDKYNENSDRPNIAEIMIEKHRNGPTGKVEFYFDDQRTTFLSIDKSTVSGVGSAGVGAGDDW